MIASNTSLSFGATEIKYLLQSLSLIAYGDRVAGKKSDLGPVGVNVTHSVRKFREARRLSFAELSRQLAELGRDVPPLGLRRIESGERRVDVDDLVALALALGVSPLALLLPTEASSLVADGDRLPVGKIWEWAKGQQPLSGDALAYWRDSNPREWADIEGRSSPDIAPAVLRNKVRADAHTRRRLIEAAASGDLVPIEYLQNVDKHLAGEHWSVDARSAESLIAQGVAQVVSDGDN